MQQAMGSLLSPEPYHVATPSMLMQPGDASMGGVQRSPLL